MATATANGVKPKSKTDEVLEYLRSSAMAADATNYDIAEQFGTDEGTVRRAKKKLEALRENPALVLEPVDIRLVDLTVHVGMQMRPSLDESKVVEYAEGIAEGRSEPIRVIELPDGRKVVTDGFHRVEAHRQNGYEYIRAYVRDGTLDDAILEAAAANADHGLPRDAQTKRNAVLALLNHADWGDRSVAWLAEAARVSRGLADSVRRQWEAGRVPAAESKRVGKDGVARPAKQFTPTPEPARDREPGEDDDLGDDDASTQVDLSNDRSKDADAYDPHREAALALPLAAKLSGERREGFVRDAALYFAISDRRKALGDLYRAHKGQVAAGGVIGSYALLVDRFLTEPHPRDWKECKAGDHSRRCHCGGRGYLVD